MINKTFAQALPRHCETREPRQGACRDPHAPHTPQSESIGSHPLSPRPCLRRGSQAGRPAQLPSCHTQQEHVCGQVCPASLGPYSGLRHSHTSVWDIQSRPSTCGRPGRALFRVPPARLATCVLFWPRHLHWKQSLIHSTGHGAG